VKFGWLIFGQHGVGLARSQWHIIRGCLSKEEMIGEEMLELLEFRLMIHRMN